MMNRQSYRALDCIETGRRVSVDQTEWECRAKNGCDQLFCPLHGEFKPDPLDEWLDEPAAKNAESFVQATFGHYDPEKF